MRTMFLCIALLLGVPASASALTSFQSPSGNIGCYIDSSEVRCDLRTHTFRPPPRPQSCDLEWGDSMAVSRRSRRGSFVCHGDTALNPRARKLPYGKSIRAGSMRCTSRTDGMRCVNGGGHGFLIARAAYKRF